MKLLGLSGKKQGGKSTTVRGLIALEFNELGYSARVNSDGDLVVVTNTETLEEGVLPIYTRRPDIINFLNETIYPFIKNYSFATSLKEICISLLGLTEEQVYGTEEQKNSLTNLKWEDLPGYFTKNYKEKNKKLGQELNIIYHEPGILTARQTMQYVGELFRKLNPNCWVDCTLRQIEAEQSEFAIIDDVRYENEVKAIQSAGGKVIRLTRSPYQDEHSSETELDNYDGFDAVIDNRELLIGDQLTKVMEKLIEFGFYKQV